MEDSISVGDYVLASHWSDFNANDPWSVGFVHSIVSYETNKKQFCRFVLCDEDGDPLMNGRQFRHAKRITPEEGNAFLKRHAQQEDN